MHGNHSEIAAVSPLERVAGKEWIRLLDGLETVDQSSRLLFMRTAGHGGCSPGLLASDRDGGRWCRART